MNQLLAKLSDNELKTRCERKAKLVELIKQTEAREKSLKELLTLCDELVAPMDLSVIDRVKPVMVTNLFEVLMP